jgi:hypothetical protein
MLLWLLEKKFNNMGELRFFDLTEPIKEYNLSVFIETGTGLGGSVESILEYDIIDKIYSIEIIEDLYNKCVDKFKSYSNIKIINSSSYNGLKEILPTISKETNILFWLDAHFPGADFHFTTYESTNNEDLRIPLKSEIDLIYSLRKGCKDVFIIDDLRIYEDGPYELGNWDKRKELGGEGIDFIINKYESTHNIHKNFNHQGYLFLLPK